MRILPHQKARCIQIVNDDHVVQSSYSETWSNNLSIDVEQCTTIFRNRGQDTIKHYILQSQIVEIFVEISLLLLKLQIKFRW